jgi:hypothetical protein
MTPEQFGAMVLQLLDAATFPGKARHEVMRLAEISESFARGEITFAKVIEQNEASI